MSRAFAGPSAGDSITFAIGNGPPDEGPITIAVLAKASSTTGWTAYMIRAKAGASASWGLLTSDNGGAKLFTEGDFGGGVSGLTTSWAWYVATKASGSAIPRFHVLPIGGAWAHTNDSSNVGDLTGPADTIWLGGDGSGSGSLTWRGSIAAAAAWPSVLSDGQVQTACTLSASDLLAAAPSWMVRLNQASTATSVSDDTGGGGDQTALSGTTVDASEPPGWDYSLTAAALVPAGLAVPVALGSPTVSLGISATPTGISIPVALGLPTVGATVPGAGPVTDAPGSWWQLAAVARTNRENARQERLAGPIACPNDGEPLQWDPRSHKRRCPYDGWISPV